MDSSLTSPNFTSLKAFCKAQRGPISTDDVNENLVLIVPILLLIAQAWCAPRSFYRSVCVSRRYSHRSACVLARAGVFVSHCPFCLTLCLGALCVECCPVCRRRAYATLAAPQHNSTKSASRTDEQHRGALQSVLATGQRLWASRIWVQLAVEVLPTLQLSFTMWLGYTWVMGTLYNSGFATDAYKPQLRQSCVPVELGKLARLSFALSSAACGAYGAGNPLSAIPWPQLLRSRVTAPTARCAP